MAGDNAIKSPRPRALGRSAHGEQAFSPHDMCRNKETMQGPVEGQCPATPSPAQNVEPRLHTADSQTLFTVAQES